MSSGILFIAMGWARFPQLCWSNGCSLGLQTVVFSFPKLMFTAGYLCRVLATSLLSWLHWEFWWRICAALSPWEMSSWSHRLSFKLFSGSFHDPSLLPSVCLWNQHHMDATISSFHFFREKAPVVHGPTFPYLEHPQSTSPESKEQSPEGFLGSKPMGSAAGFLERSLFF